MDHSVNPCHDFYRHVCGRWMRDTHKPSSFMIDVARNMTDVWHQALTKDHTKGDYHELRQGAAFFYRSCLTFLEQQTDIAAAAQELFKALNLPVSKWLAETRWSSSFTTSFTSPL
ncbi:membrane metallo-endopeptidase-like 1 isoform X2 [Amblyomma americanum]